VINSARESKYSHEDPRNMPAAREHRPRTSGVCSRPKASLPASWVSSCKSQGRMKRTGNRPEKIHGRTQTVGGKRIKGRKYGGPLPDYSAK